MSTELPDEIWCTIFEYAKMRMLINTQIREIAISRIFSKIDYNLRNCLGQFFYDDKIPRIEGTRYILISNESFPGCGDLIIYDTFEDKSVLHVLILPFGIMTFKERWMDLTDKTRYIVTFTLVDEFSRKLIDGMPWTYTLSLENIARDNFSAVMTRYDPLIKTLYLITTALELNLEIPEVNYHNEITSTSEICEEFSIIINKLEPQIRAQLGY